MSVLLNQIHLRTPTWDQALFMVQRTLREMHDRIQKSTLDENRAFIEMALTLSCSVEMVRIESILRTKIRQGTNVGEDVSWLEERLPVREGVAMSEDGGLVTTLNTSDLSVFGADMQLLDGYDHEQQNKLAFGIMLETPAYPTPPPSPVQCVNSSMPPVGPTGQSLEILTPPPTPPSQNTPEPIMMGKYRVTKDETPPPQDTKEPIMMDTYQVTREETPLPQHTQEPVVLGDYPVATDESPSGYTYAYKQRLLAQQTAKQRKRALEWVGGKRLKLRQHLNRFDMCYVQKMNCFGSLEDIHSIVLGVSQKIEDHLMDLNQAELQWMNWPLDNLLRLIEILQEDTDGRDSRIKAIRGVLEGLVHNFFRDVVWGRPGVCELAPVECSFTSWRETEDLDMKDLSQALQEEEEDARSGMNDLVQRMNSLDAFSLPSQDPQQPFGNVALPYGGLLQGNANNNVFGQPNQQQASPWNPPAPHFSQQNGMQVQSQQQPQASNFQALQASDGVPVGQPENFDLAGRQRSLGLLQKRHKDLVSRMKALFRARDGLMDCKPDLKRLKSTVDDAIHSLSRLSQNGYPLNAAELTFTTWSVQDMDDIESGCILMEPSEEKNALLPKVRQLRTILQAAESTP